MTDGGKLGWMVVAGAFIGTACSATILVPYTFGYLMSAPAAAMGWKRTDFASAISVYMLVLLVLLPFAGRVIDKIGARLAASGSLFAMAVVFAVMGLTLNDLQGLHIGYGVLALAAVGASPLSYARAVTSYFDKRRGLALGIALCGVGLGTALLPVYVRACIEWGGWRAGFYGISALLAFVIAPFVWTLVRERADQEDASHAAGTDRGAFLEALRSGRFWKMLVSVFVLGLGISGITPLLPGLLEERGAPESVAVRIQMVLGISSIIGRLAGGWLMDRIFAPWVTVVASCAAIMGLLLMLQVGEWGLIAALVGVGLGLATGLESDVLAYLSSRYFPRAVFSSVLGLLVAGYIAGAAVGPVAFAYGEKLAGGNVFMLFSALLIIGALLQLSLGRYTTAPSTVSRHS
ncbi:MFS transporter [Hyphomonas sp. WL0036]|uniref:MFS transporter n=1 Tax=Hyphomonas sediminis TaxID=2866160 RepID=UPI001C80959D|nr:MFS transporter [Hyphomonas sediminis]MBY9068156.1 MFS transporter [Hyphomonas sediminis]